MTNPTPPIFDPPQPEPTRKKVAIVGFASSSRDQAPFDDESFEVWIVNELYRMVPRWDRLFEMHTWEHLNRERYRGDELVRGEDHIGAMAAVPPGEGKVIYMQELRPEIPASVRFDIHALGRVFQQSPPYFTSTPSMMIALALAQDFEEIHLYGIDLLNEGEYQYERPCMEWWIGLAQGMGKRVYVPDSSALCKANFVYGESEPDEDGVIQRLIGAVRGEVEKLEGNQANIAKQQHTINGAVQFGRSVQIWLEHIARGGLVGGSTDRPVEIPPLKIGAQR